MLQTWDEQAANHTAILEWIRVHPVQAREPMKPKPVMTMIEAIEEYQVPGAVGDFDKNTAVIDNGWVGHVPATFVSGIGLVFLGMPRGFMRLGPIEAKYFRLWIFETWEACWAYDKYNVPCWKHLDEHGNTLVRGLSPRVNTPFLHVILGDHRDKIDCLEITAADLAEMD